MSQYPKLSWRRQDTPAVLHSMLECLGEEYPLVEGEGKGLRVRFELGAPADECRVTRQGDTATISYSRPALALRAVSALLAGLVSPGGERRERTAIPSLGIMLDCSRNAVITVQHFKRWLRRLALFGYTTGMLYLEDTYELPGEPMFGYMRGRYTADELRDIDAYAARLGIEMVGCIQTLGHLEQILKWHAYGDLKDTDSIMLVDDDRTYALIGKMISRMQSVFGSRRIHVGMDEAIGLGRGRYEQRFGPRAPFDIFNRHLARVNAICRKHGLRPMIWSDMYFRMGSATGEYYDSESRVPPAVKRRIPKGVQMVYWDYDHRDASFYAKMIRCHRHGLGSDPLVASAIGTANRFWYDVDASAVNACMDACRSEGVKELIFTLWGDDGACCDFDSALAGLATAAERLYGGNPVDDAALARRFRAVCHADLAAHRKAAELQRPLNAAAVLWDDPLMAIYQRHMTTFKKTALEEAEKHLVGLARLLKSCARDRAAGDLRHAWIMTQVLAAKVNLTRRLYKAYYGQDRRELAAVRRAIPGVIRQVERLSDSFRRLWLARNKPFGLEVIQIRLGGLVARYRELARRLDDYQRGKIAAIDEIEVNRRPPEKSIAGEYRRIATASVIL